MMWGFVWLSWQPTDTCAELSVVAKALRRDYKKNVKKTKGYGVGSTRIPLIRPYEGAFVRVTKSPVVFSFFRRESASD